MKPVIGRQPSQFKPTHISIIVKKVKVKVKQSRYRPRQACNGIAVMGSRRVRLPDFKTVGT